MSALWTAAELRSATNGLLRRPISATGVSIDSRSCKPGDLFIALVGENGDGHRFVAQALARGAAGAMVHALPEDVADDAPLLQVADTFRALHDLAVFARARFRGRLVAVTGSVGKTTSKEMLRRILSAHGKSWAAEASHNNHWGVPLTLARLPGDAKFCVVEIGMNHAGEIAPLARLAQPHAVLITTIAAAHIGYLGSIEAIAAEKAAIGEGLLPGGIAVLPLDSAQYDQMAAAISEAEIQSFGRAEAATHRLLQASTDAEGSDVVASIAGETVSFRLPAPGAHMAMNAVGALAAAAAIGADPATGAVALASFSAGAGRGARQSLALPAGHALLLDESYNGNAASIRASLAVLALQPAARRIAVLGDMLELGAAGPAEHAGLAPDIGRTTDLLFTCGPLMAGLHDAIPAPLRGAHAADSASLAPIVAASLRDGDAVLVKGSLGSRMKIIVDALLAARVPDAPKDPR